ncbi:RNA helicase [Flavobacterium psychrolimnae]|uniref:RNA helicase n=1 Tax=Flavobacterium psychrolimnae TaxID=249351 RepID=A0A366AY73_9FLAO|nr:RNA helicase [Flavobacterium psychrolimnae]RBN49812.1 RNA helicase [Flavobacterium psychrolimnae]
MTEKNTKTVEKIAVKKKCGIIMPIASNPDYPNEHWKEVLLILSEAISQTEFEPRLVSDDVAIGLIHDRIVNNIYSDDIVVCDVSSKNPNVMFELGMRLAFDKPTIIIKDEKTGYSFDTGVIEHINYPSSLRFNQIVEFKLELIKRINATYEKSQSEPNYSPFLKSFGKTIVPAAINQTEIPESKFIISQLESLTNEMHLMRVNQNGRNENYTKRKYDIILNEKDRKDYINSSISKFIKINNHLKYEDFTSENFLPFLRDQITNDANFVPSSLEIKNSLNQYFARNNVDLK